VGSFDPNGKNQVCVSLFAGKEKRQRFKVAWTRPPEGWCKVKVNVDGAFTESTGKTGTGVVIRDHHSKVLLSAWRYLWSCASAEEAEAMTILHTILKSDCSYLVGVLSSKKASPRTAIGKTVSEVMAIGDGMQKWRSSRRRESKIVQLMSLHSWLGEMGTQRCGVSICYRLC
jgi:ribonuclease HI